jgi:hypothetical protein
MVVIDESRSGPQRAQVGTGLVTSMTSDDPVGVPARSPFPYRPLNCAVVIYDRPVWQLMSDAADAVDQPFTMAAMEEWFRQNYPKIKGSTVQAHIRGQTANDPSRMHYPSLAAREPLFFREASGELVRFDPASHPGAGEFVGPRSPRSTARTRRGSGTQYIDTRVISALGSEHHRQELDVTKLLALIMELNDSYARGNTYAAHALLRAILDHVPPMLGCANFASVAGNYRWSRTDKGYMSRLLDFRLQADDALHRQISRRLDLLSLEDMPSRTWINRLLQECADPARSGG